MPSERQVRTRQPDATASAFWSDLRQIRESRKITLRSIEGTTKIPISILRDFERDGLRSNQNFNAVYRTSLISAFAKAIDVDPEMALESDRATASGSYDGELAKAYLLWANAGRSSTSAATQEVAAVDSTGLTVDHEAETHGRGISTTSTERQKPTPRRRTVRSQPKRSSTSGIDGPALTILVLVSIVLLTLVWSALQPAEEPEVVSPKVTLTAAEPALIFPDQPVMLGDTIDVSITASAGPLGPMRIQIDGGKVNPYWLEQGKSLTFRGTESFLITGELSRMSLSVAGTTWSFADFGTQRSVEVTRADLEEFLQSSRP